MNYHQDKDCAIVCKFPYLEGDGSKILYECPCGAEMEMFTITRDNNVRKDNSLDISIEHPFGEKITFVCNECNGKASIVYRGWTDEEKVKERNVIINNLLNFKHYKST